MFCSNTKRWYNNKVIIEDHNDFSLEVPEGNLKMLNAKGYQGKHLKFGIRPENIHTGNAFIEAFPNVKVKTVINVSELLGAESQLYCKVGSQEYIAIVNARDHIQPGTEVEVGFDVNKAHFFDPETELTIN